MERQRKMSEKMLENRKTAVKTMQKFRVPKGADEAAAKRITAAYGAAWRAKSGKFLSQSDVDRLAEVYGLPPEAFNIKQTKNGYRLVRTSRSLFV